MESDFTPEDALLAIDRAAAAPWIDYPPTPWWYYPAIGAWVAALLLALLGLGGLWGAVAALGLVALELWFVKWMKQRRGTWPRVTNPPQEFKAALRWFIAGTTVLVLAIFGAHAIGGAGFAAAVSFVGVTVGLYVYEKAYERAVVAVRQRLEQPR